MMKNKYLVLIIAVVLGFSSCIEDPEVSTITTVAPFSIVVDVPVLITTNDSEDRVIEVPITLNDNQIVSTTLAISVDDDNTTATEGVDFDLLTTTISIPGVQRTGVIEVMINEDFDVEGMETISLLIEGVTSDDQPWTVDNSATAEIQIVDETDNDFRMVLGWDKTYNVDVAVTGTAEYGGPFNLLTGAPYSNGNQDVTGCGIADFDFIVVNDEFNSFYATAQTSACPEILDFPAMGTITNGTETTDTFFVFSDLYLNWGSSEFSSAPFPLLADCIFQKQNSTMGTWDQFPLNAYQSDAAGGLGSQAQWRPILEVRRDNGVWTVLEGAVEVFSAREIDQLQDIFEQVRANKDYE